MLVADRCSPWTIFDFYDTALDLRTFFSEPIIRFLPNHEDAPFAALWIGPSCKFERCSWTEIYINGQSMADSW